MMATSGHTTNAAKNATAKAPRAQAACARLPVVGVTKGLLSKDNLRPLLGPATAVGFNLGRIQR